MKKSMRLLSLLLSIIMILGILPVSSLAANSTGLDNFKKVNSYNNCFTDVKEGSWYYDGVKTAFEYGLMNGKGDKLFDPDGYITGLETQAIAARLRSIYYTGKADFRQTTPWYKPYIDYLYGEKNSSDVYYWNEVGLWGSFPTDRESFVSILYEALPSDMFSAINNVPDGSVADVHRTTLPDIAIEAIYTFYRAGILAGSNEAGDFKPSDRITRSEAATVIARIILPTLRYDKNTKIAVSKEEIPSAEDNLKFGQFIKLVALKYWPNYKYSAPYAPTHWAKPYVESLDRNTLNASIYDNDKLEQYITRLDAVKMIYVFMLNQYGFEISLDYSNSYLIPDIGEDEIEKAALCNTLRTGLFDDGTFYTIGTDFNKNGYVTYQEALSLLNRAEMLGENRK